MKYSAGLFGRYCRVLIFGGVYFYHSFLVAFPVRTWDPSFGIPFSGDTDGHVSGVVLIDEASGVFDIACW